MLEHAVTTTDQLEEIYQRLPESRDELIASHMRWITKLVNKFVFKYGAEPEEAAAQAMFLVFTRFKYFDQTKGRFTTFLAHTLPRDLHAWHRSNKLIRVPGSPHSEKGIKIWEKAQTRGCAMFSGFKDETEFHPEHRDEQLDLQDVYEAMNRVLSERERGIVFLWYHGHTFRDIGVELGISFQRVQQLYYRSIKKIRGYFEGAYIKTDVDLLEKLNAHLREDHKYCCAFIGRIAINWASVRVMDYALEFYTGERPEGYMAMSTCTKTCLKREHLYWKKKIRCTK